jgi:hypothetical protein
MHTHTKSNGGEDRAYEVETDDVVLAGVLRSPLITFSPLPFENDGRRQKIDLALTVPTLYLTTPFVFLPLQDFVVKRVMG